MVRHLAGHKFCACFYILKRISACVKMRPILSARFSRFDELNRARRNGPFSKKLAILREIDKVPSIKSIRLEKTITRDFD